MKSFVSLRGIAAPLPIDNIDTDAIIPSRETQSVARFGYGEKLFANWRYRPGTREVNPNFILNQAPYDRAEILVAGQNFGCGSSREAAVWSLVQFGIRCVISESYGAIFRNNAIRNGLLPVTLAENEIKTILEEISQLNSANATLTADLKSCSIITSTGLVFNFKIAERDREMLLSGADEIELTLHRQAEIEAFREQDRRARPWVYDALWLSGKFE